MSGFEEIRPLEGIWNPTELRRELREMFGRWLSRSRNTSPPQSTEALFDELSLRKLIQHYRPEFLGSRKDIANSWDASEERNADGGPTFDELKQLGWVKFDGCHWIMPGMSMSSYKLINYPSQSTKEFLLGLYKLQLVAKTETISSDVQEIADKATAQLIKSSYIPITNPDVFLGNLWKELCPVPLPSNQNERVTDTKIEEPDKNAVNDSRELLASHNESIDRAFIEWSAWCRLFGAYSNWDPNLSWSSLEKQYCHEAAYRILTRQKLWGSWRNDLEDYTDLLENTFTIARDKLEYRWSQFDSPPETLVERLDWLASRDIENLMMERLFLHYDGPCAVSFAFSLLCSELETTDFGSDIALKNLTLLEFATSHPMALLTLKLRIDADPLLLVDMLMHHGTTCMATKILIEWVAGSGLHSDRIRGREAQTKAFAVEDALSFMAYYMGEGKLDLKDYASLITWCYIGKTRNGHAPTDSRRSVGRRLIGLLAKQNEDVKSLVLKHMLVQAAYKNNVPRACFAAVLDVLNFLPNQSGDACLPIVELYSKFAQERNLDWTDAADLTPPQAMRLVSTAIAQNERERDALLIPFDSAEILRATPRLDKPSVRSSIGKALRVHVRLLARAISGWPTTKIVPMELSDALKLLTSRSVVEHDEKGRVGALTDRYSSSHFMGNEEGSPASDLAEAYQKLDGDNQKALLHIFMQSDDPVFLAELSQYLPYTETTQIHERLQQLKPGEASVPWTWTEVQHRIESVLAVGQVNLARDYLSDINGALNRAPSQFRLGLFGVELQILMKEKNWETLDSINVPPELKGTSGHQAQNQLDFYRATSQLLRQNGDLAKARDALHRLASLPNASFAYKENLFAVAIQQLLGTKLQPLDDANRTAGEILLAEINAEIESNEDRFSNTMFANRAILLIGLQRPEDALESLNKRRRDVTTLDLEHIVVLAKYEMGQKGEAMAILNAALTKYGDNNDLLNLKRDLESGDTTLIVASASGYLDPISPIRNALQQLAELLPSQVGDVLGPPGKGVRGYLVRQVARAVSSLQHMASILRDKKNEADEARFEDDLNTAVREVLGASLAVAKWDVADQSFGGQTAKGNPGERDAVIRVAGQEIAIYEALVCSGLNKKNIKSHFDKLIDYGNCDLYFHVIYSYAKEINPLLDYVREMLKENIPHNLTYLSCEELMPPDYEISGYLATYRVDHREVAVVFMVADLRTNRF